MNTLAHRHLWLLIGWGLVVLVSVLSLLPGDRLPTVDYNDKLGHLLAYFTLMAWFGQIYGARLKPVLALLAMGGLIELLQGWSGWRDMSGLDLLANAVGIAIGWLLARRAPDLLLRLDGRLA